MEYRFDVNYPPDEEEEVKKGIKGNVTLALDKILKDPGDLLFTFVESYGLKTVTKANGDVDAIVTKDGEAKGVLLLFKDYFILNRYLLWLYIILYSHFHVNMCCISLATGKHTQYPTPRP